MPQKRSRTGGGRASGLTSTWKKTRWPFDRAAAAYITPCYGARIDGANVYVYLDQRELTRPSWFKGTAADWKAIHQPHGAVQWHYTVSAGANSDRSHTGLTQTSGLGAAKEYAERVARRR